MTEKIPFHAMTRALNGQPQAVARVRGSGDDCAIRGVVYFFQMPHGVLVAACVTGLPDRGGFFGFHIHSGEACSGSPEDPFADTLAHFESSSTFLSCQQEIFALRRFRFKSSTSP